MKSLRLSTVVLVPVLAIVACDSSTDEDEVSVVPATPAPTPRPEDAGGPSTVVPVPPVEQDAGVRRPTCAGESGEPNDTAGNAVVLAAATDCDNTGGKLTGIIAGSADVDLFRVDVADTNLCTFGTQLTLSAPGVRICVAASCKDGAAPKSFDCHEGVPGSKAVVGTLPDGRRACCTTDVAPLVPTLECQTRDDSATMTVSVGAPAGARADQCIPYEVTWNF